MEYKITSKPDSFISNFTDFNSLIIRNAFPTRDALFYACRLISEGSLGTESNEGLEKAGEVFQLEIEARKRYSDSDFCRERRTDIMIKAYIASCEIKQLQVQGLKPDSPEFKTAVAKNNTYALALDPDLGIKFIIEAIRYKKGDDFNDSGKDLGLSPDTPFDFPDNEM